MHARWDNIKNQDEIYWRRPLRGWEQESLQSLGHITENIKLSNKEDKLFWKVNGGDYSTSQGYDILQGVGNQETHWLLLWKLCVPPKVKIFLWLFMHERLPTMSEIHRRGFQINTTCIWCKRCVEDINHLLWQCTLAKLCWKFLEQWFEVKVTQAQNCKDMLLNASKFKDSQGL